jgi:hypothetical protein
MDLIIENYIDISYIIALMAAVQCEKRVDFVGLFLKNGMSDKWKTVIIGAVHAGVWMYFFKADIKIILTSYLVSVAAYDYFIKKLVDKLS